MPRKKSPPVNLDKYLEGRGKTYISYAIGAKMYSMPYWTFVSVAKEAGATWALRKTAIVDMPLARTACIRLIAGRRAFAEMRIVPNGAGHVRNTIVRSIVTDVQDLARENSGIRKIKLQTDKKREAYNIYRHWGFQEDELIPMHKYFL